jgi:carbonic anhydrase
VIAFLCTPAAAYVNGVSIAVRRRPHAWLLSCADQRRLGLVDNWLRHVGDVAQKHDIMLSALDTMTLRNMRLCELNAIEQVVNVCHTTMVMDAWERGQKLAVHAWCYSLDNGHMNDLDMHVDARDALWPTYAKALNRLAVLAGKSPA